MTLFFLRSYQFPKSQRMMRVQSPSPTHALILSGFITRRSSASNQVHCQLTLTAPLSFFIESQLLVMFHFFNCVIHFIMIIQTFSPIYLVIFLLGPYICFFFSFPLYFWCYWAFKYFVFAFYSPSYVI